MLQVFSLSQGRYGFFVSLNPLHMECVMSSIFVYLNDDFNFRFEDKDICIPCGTKVIYYNGYAWYGAFKFVIQPSECTNISQLS